MSMEDGELCDEREATVSSEDTKFDGNVVTDDEVVGVLDDNEVEDEDDEESRSIGAMEELKDEPLDIELPLCDDVDEDGDGDGDVDVDDVERELEDEESKFGVDSEVDGDVDIPADGEEDEDGEDEEDDAEVKEDEDEHIEETDMDQASKGDGSDLLYVPDDESRLEVYVRNISYRAGEEDIKKLFADCGKIEKITLPRDPSTGRPKGFCFVKFGTDEEVQKAIDKKDRSDHFQREIQVRRNKGKILGSQKSPTDHTTQRAYQAALRKKPRNCVTVYVGNVPFEANEDEMYKLFSRCGPVTAVRIVRQKFSQMSRGFCYIQFAETESVDKAIMMNGTQVKSRIIRVDYADPYKPNQYPQGRHSKPKRDASDFMRGAVCYRSPHHMSPKMNGMSSMSSMSSMASGHGMMNPMSMAASDALSMSQYSQSLYPSFRQTVLPIHMHVPVIRLSPTGIYQFTGMPGAAASAAGDVQFSYPNTAASAAALAAFQTNQLAAAAAARYGNYQFLPTPRMPTTMSTMSGVHPSSSHLSTLPPQTSLSSVGLSGAHPLRSRGDSPTVYHMSPSPPPTMTGTCQHHTEDCIYCKDAEVYQSKRYPPSWQ